MTVQEIMAVKDWDRAPVKVEKIDDLTLDLNLYPRKEIDQDTVHKYAKALKLGCVFPDIKVGLLKGEKIIVDGVHRVRSRRRMKIEYVDCAELHFESEAELFAEAVRLNAVHGKGYSDDDVKSNIHRLQKFKFSTKDIVALVHVSASEIYNDMAAPITHLVSPSGRRIRYDPCCVPKVDCRGANPVELVNFKNALLLIRDVAHKGCIPLDDALFKDLVIQCRLALMRVHFHV